jgi:hypothetical protein
MIAIPIAPDQIGTVGRCPRCAGTDAGGRISEGFGFGQKGLLEDCTVLCLSRPSGASRTTLQSLNDTVIETSDNKLAHTVPRRDIV